MYCIVEYYKRDQWAKCYIQSGALLATEKSTSDTIRWGEKFTEHVLKQWDEHCYRQREGGFELTWKLENRRRRLNYCLERFVNLKFIPSTSTLWEDYSVSVGMCSQIGGKVCLSWCLRLSCFRKWIKVFRFFVTFSKLQNNKRRQLDCFLRPRFRWVLLKIMPHFRV